MVFRINNFSSFSNFGQSNRSSQNSSANSFSRSSLIRTNSTQSPAKQAQGEDAFKLEPKTDSSSPSYIKGRALEAMDNIDELKKELLALDATNLKTYSEQVDKINAQIQQILEYKMDGKNLLGTDPTSAMVVVSNFAALTNTSQYSKDEALSKFTTTESFRSAVTSALPTDLAAIGSTRSQIESEKRGNERNEESRKLLEKLRNSRNPRARKNTGGRSERGSVNGSMFINSRREDPVASTDSGQSSSSSSNETPTNSQPAAPAAWTSKMSGFGTAYTYDATRDQQQEEPPPEEPPPVEPPPVEPPPVEPPPVEPPPEDSDGGDITPVGDGDGGGAEGPAVGTFYMEADNLYLMTEGGAVQYFQTGTTYDTIMIDEATAIVGSSYGEIQTSPDNVMAYVWTAGATEKGEDGWVEYAA